MYFWHNASVSAWKMNMTHNWNALLVNSSRNSFRFRYSVYLSAYLQAKYSCSEEREQFISLYLPLSIFFLLSSCFKGRGVSRWLKTHLKTYFQVSAAAFFHMLRFQVSDFSQDIHSYLGRIEFGLIDNSIFMSFFSCMHIVFLLSSSEKIAEKVSHVKRVEMLHPHIPCALFLQLVAFSFIVIIFSTFLQ